MSKSDKNRFEEYFLDQPALVEKIELAQSMRRGLAGTAATNAAASPSSESMKTGWSIWPDQLWFPQVSRWATAFAVLAIFSVAQLVYFSHHIGQLQAPQANTPILLLGQVRGGSDRDVPAGLLYLRKDIRWFSLELDLGWPLAPEYSMLVRDESSGELIARVDQLTASLNETLVVSLSAKAFQSGDYRLEISAGDELVSSYRMRVIRKN